MKSEYKPIAKLKCGAAIGTAFLVTTQRALTARHTIDDHLESGEKIELFFPGIAHEEIDREAKVLFPKEPYNGLDIAILELTEPIEEAIPLTLCASTVQSGGNWTSFGFPTSKRLTGEVFHGLINQAYIKREYEGQYDLDLACNHPQIIDPKYITSGASGSPIFNNDRVIGVLSDKIPGSSIGGVSIVSCQPFLETEAIPLDDIEHSYSHFSHLEEVSLLKNDIALKKDEGVFNSTLEQTVVGVALNPFQQKLERIKETVVSLIEDFPVDTQLKLHQSLNEVVGEISSSNPAILTNYLHHYRFPFTFSHNNEVGLEQLIEILTLIRCEFSNVEIFNDDPTANLCMDEQLDLFALVVYAVRRHTKMPQIILELTRRIQRTPTGKKAIRRGEQLLPYPLILDNCSGHKKVNLCNNCQSEFLFENILKDFCAGEEDGYFTGVEQNNFGLLHNTKVICADCLRNLNNEITNLNDLLERIREMTT
ncbi:hypothetical protein COM86_21700 [Priestia megaterium]|uniref:ABC-three component system protein n=1 Tax=Priestia megaterium TaxID=1404 RepID=UPI000BEDCD92|nr:ABC-three component system protein [Priestia megaterium]PEB61977.1 hypothetical protein COM86_21700 [Priestia megaterium]